MSSTSRCNGCNAEIEWAITERNGRRIPLNPGMDPNGNLLVVSFTYDTTPVVRKVDAGSDPACRQSHFATCPNRPKRKPTTRR